MFILSYIFISLIFITLTACFVQLICVYSLSAYRTKYSGDLANTQIYPGISILKPLKGILPDLEKNLSGFFELDYPRYEIIFCLEDHRDKALKVINKLKEKYPNTEVKISVRDRHYTNNPKVNQLIPGYKMTDNDIVLISDADIHIGKDYLKNLAMHYHDLNVGLVSNLIRAGGNGSLGAIFENLYINTFIAGGISSLYCLFKHPCVVGKSLSFRKNYLENIGGFDIVKDYLAEDYIMGMKFKQAGKKVVISDYLVNSNTNKRTIKQFFGRNIRWEQMRLKMAGFLYFLDLLVNPVLFALIYALINGFNKSTGELFILILMLKIILDTLIGTRIDPHSTQFTYRFSVYLLGPVKDLILAVIWFIPFFKNKVSWGGKNFKLGKNTQLHPVE